MGDLKIRVRLNEGRRGIPLGKLGHYAQQLLTFLKQYTSDLGLPITTNWLADDFANSSTVFSAINPDKVNPDDETRFNDGIVCMINCDTVAADQYFSGITPGTISAFTEFGMLMDPDETISLGTFNRDDKIRYFILTRERVSFLRQLISVDSKVRYYGAVRGRIRGLIKEDARPHLTIRDLVTGQLIKCYFKMARYREIIKLLEQRDAIIYVSGMVVADRHRKQVKSIEMEKVLTLPAPTEAERVAFFSALNHLDPATDTVELIRLVRDDA